MPIYITRGRYSAESIRNLVANPEDRLPAVRNLVEAAGAKLLNFYVTLGHYDFLVITEAPSAKEASAFILAAASAGSVTDIETTEAFTSSEAKQVLPAPARQRKNTNCQASRTTASDRYAARGSPILNGHSKQSVAARGQFHKGASQKLCASIQSGQDRTTGCHNVGEEISASTCLRSGTPGPISAVQGPRS